MASTFTSLYIHFVFSTKNRKNLIDNGLKSHLWAYMGGIARQNNMVAMAVGGTGNHVHLLISIPASISPSKAIQLVKANSSKWINEENHKKLRFSWQVGYGGFSVSPRQIGSVKKYIQNQEEHHKIKTFEEEYIGFLRDSGIEYDERYLWE